MARLLLRIGGAAAAAIRTGPHAEKAGGRLPGEPARPAFVHYQGFAARRPAAAAGTGFVAREGLPALVGAASAASSSSRPPQPRPEQRRVGKECDRTCRSPCAPDSKT